MLVHQVESLLLNVKGCESGHFAASAVVQVIIIKADDGGDIGHKGVRLPSSGCSESTA